MSDGWVQELSRAPLAALRLRLQTAVRTMVVGPQAAASPLREGSLDDGFFDNDSVTWRIHTDASMLIGGIRALLLQTLHPSAMAGIAEHSAYRTDPTGRLHRTAAYVGTTTFGTHDEVRSAVAMVKRVHQKVVGTTPTGEAYSANDPHLLGWVHHTLVESFLVSYRRFGGDRLSASEADRYVAEQAKLADLFGTTPPARSVAELDRYMAAIRHELGAGTQARDAVRFLLFPPLPVASLAPFGVLASAAVGLMPRWARRELRLPRLPVTESLLVRPTAKALTQTLGWAMSAPPPDR